MISKYLLEIKNLSIWEKDKDFLVKDININIKYGQIVAIMGHTGSGKTLISRAIMGMIAKNLKSSGNIFFEGIDVMNFKADEWKSIRGRKIGMSFQNPESSLNPLLKNKIQLQLSMRGEFKDVEKRLEKLYFPKESDILKKYPFELSGGMAQRFMIALALGRNVKLLIFDEPTRGLDLISTKYFFQMVKRLVRNKNIGVLLLSHDSQLVQKLADYTYVINKGKICEENITNKIFTEPNSLYSKSLVANDPRFYKIVESPESRLKTFNETHPELKDNKLLVVNNISTGYKKSLFSSKTNYIFENLSFYIKEGEVVGIFGNSGCGKTTLANCLLGLIKYEGEVLFDNKSLNNKNHTEQIQIVRQRAENSFLPNMPIGKNFEEIFKIHKKDFLGKDKDDLIKTSLRNVNLEDIYERLEETPNKFSGGQLQRLALARVLLVKTKLLILDEATSMLDLKTQADILNLIINLQLKRKFAVLFISHDQKLMEQFANRIYFMNKKHFKELNYERM